MPGLFDKKIKENRTADFKQREYREENDCQGSLKMAAGLAAYI